MPSKFPQETCCYELTDEGLEKLAKEIESLGYDRATAGHYAALIGDTPCIDPDTGEVIVTDYCNGKVVVLARLAISFFFFDDKPGTAWLENQIAALGFDKKTAHDFAARISAPEPFIDKDGKVVVFDDLGKIVTRLSLEFFSSRKHLRNPNEPEFWYLYKAIARSGVADREAARWSALVGLAGGPSIGDDGKFPVLDENGRELARLPAGILMQSDCSRTAAVLP